MYFLHEEEQKLARVERLLKGASADLVKIGISMGWYGNCPILQDIQANQSPMTLKPELMHLKIRDYHI